MRTVVITLLICVLVIAIVKLVSCLIDLFKSRSNKYKMRELARFVVDACEHKAIIIFTTVEASENSEFEIFLLHTVNQKFDLGLKVGDKKYCLIEIPNHTLYDGIVNATISKYKANYYVYSSSINITDKCALLIPKEYTSILE